MTTRLEVLIERGKSIAAFCARVRERGGRAVIEETIDLPMLRAAYVIERSIARARRRERSAA